MTGVPRIAPKGLERISWLRKLARTYGVDVSENVVSDLVRQRRLRVQHFVGPGQRTFHYYDPAKDQEHNLRVIMTEGRRILNASKRISAQKEAAAKEKKVIAKAGERKPALRPKRTPVRLDFKALNSRYSQRTILVRIQTSFSGQSQTSLPNAANLLGTRLPVLERAITAGQIRKSKNNTVFVSDLMSFVQGLA